MPITEVDLSSLAQKRAQAIVDYIKDVSSLDKDHLIILETSKDEGDNDFVRIKLSLVTHKSISTK